MNESELNDALNSDMRLWDAAAKTDDGQDSISLLLDLPYGIGETSVTLQGLDNAEKRRDAIGVYGNYIRNLIENKVGDDAITSKAAYQRALAEPVQEDVVVASQAVVANPILAGPAAVEERLKEVVGLILELVDQNKELTRELLGLQAYMEATHAPTDKGTPDRNPASEDTEKV